MSSLACQVIYFAPNGILAVSYTHLECEAQIAKMREATDKFLADVDATIERLSWRRGGKGYHPSYPVRRPGPESYSSPNRISALRGFASSKGCLLYTSQPGNVIIFEHSIIQFITRLFLRCDLFTPNIV